jgi:glycolate oxidase iron-sulfur subunit
MMERARAQVEPLRSRRARFVRWLGLDVVLPRPRLLGIASALQPLATPFMPRRVRRLLPRPAGRLRPLPRRTDPPVGTELRGTVAILSGCVQDQWFREVNRATIRVLARGGWRVVVPRAQRCCGALHAHNGRLSMARSLARRNARAFDGVDAVVVNAAGCSAHMKTYQELADDAAMPPVLELMEFLHDQRLRAETVAMAPMPQRVAYHDACHALRAQGIKEQPRTLLRDIPGLEVVEIPNGDQCCGAAGIYNVTEPEMSDALMRRKAEAIASTGCRIVASANPGCTMQIAAGTRALGYEVEVVHPVQLLDRASKA